MWKFKNITELKNKLGAKYNDSYNAQTKEKTKYGHNIDEKKLNGVITGEYSLNPLMEQIYDYLDKNKAEALGMNLFNIKGEIIDIKQLKQMFGAENQEFSLFIKN